MFSSILFIFAVVITGVSTAALFAALRVEKQQKSHHDLLLGRLRVIEQRLMKLLCHAPKGPLEERTAAEEKKKKEVVLNLGLGAATESTAKPKTVFDEALEKDTVMKSAQKSTTPSRPQQPKPIPTPKPSEQPYHRQNAVRKPSQAAGTAFENGTTSPKPDQSKTAAKEASKPPVAAIVDAEVVHEKEDTSEPRAIQPGSNVPPRTPVTPSTFAATPNRPNERSRPYTAPQMPPVVNPLEARTKEVLSKIWNWIIVGEEFRPKDVSMEYAIATNWLVRIGALILICGIGFFIQDAIRKGLLGPHARVAMTSITGLIMVTGGSFILGRKKYHLFGQGLVGIGIVSLYFSVFASMQMFDLIEQTPAFLLMGLITCLACGIAYRFNTLLIALMGVLGGYATPAMLSTGVVNLPGLLAYLSILTAGVLALSYVKDWHLLRAVSLLATWGWAIGSLGLLWEDRAFEFAVVMPFMVGFFVMFSTMNFLYNFMKRKESTLLELFMIWINAAVFFFVSYGLFEITFGVDDRLACCKLRLPPILGPVVKVELASHIC